MKVLSAVRGRRLGKVSQAANSAEDLRTHGALLPSRQATERQIPLSPMKRGRGQHFAQPARWASLIFHLPLGKECDQSRAGDQQNKGDCNSNNNHSRFLCGGIFRVLESLDWNWRSIERVAGSDRVTLSITLIGNVQQYYQSTPSPGHFKRKLSDFASIFLHTSGNAASPKSVTLRRLDQSILRRLPE
jgi:hypothetical protein